MLKKIVPYWKALILGVMASLLFVAFNSASVWLTASFLNVLMPEQQVQTQPDIPTDQAPQNISANEKLKALTNRLIIRDTPMQSLKILCLTILIAFLLKNLFFYLKNISFGYIQLKIITDLRNQLYSHLHNLSLAFFHRKRSGELSSIMLNDINMMRHSFGVSFNKLLVEPINIITFIIILFIISWRLSIIAVFILPVSAYIISKIGRSIRRKSLRNSRQIAGIMSIIQETIYGIRVVKAFAMEQFEKKRFFRETARYFQLVFRSIKLRSVSSPVSETLGVLMGILLLWIGGRQVLSETGLDAEDFVRYIILLFAILGPIKKLNNVNIEMQQGFASASRVFGILDTPPKILEIPNPVQLTEFRDNIRYNDVSFHYETSDSDVLADINLEVKKGEIVAIIGLSGAGKSTLVDLLPRFYDPQAGNITIDGVDIKTASLESLRSLMGIVTQETILFNDTIFNNIAYGMEQADKDDVKAAATAANAYDFIATLPERFDTEIGDKGARLSGGQKQRIAIARALLKNPPILIFDEATSSLDTESELKVQQAIEALMKDRTVFVIAHRLSTITNASKIIVLDHGKIVESGTHEELIEQANSLYKYLYTLQFSTAESD